MEKTLCALVVSILVSACASNPAPGGVRVADGATPSATAQASAAPRPSSTDTQQRAGSTQADPRSGLLSNRVILFDYDQDAVKPEYQALLRAHAAFLTQNSNRKVRFEGHADERGSREYNMALGQRRADAVRRAASALGAGAARTETVSFGEDKPKSSGHDEAGWSQNRRVEIRYDGEQ